MIPERFLHGALTQRKAKRFSEQVQAAGGTLEADYNTWYNAGNGMARTYAPLYLMAGAGKAGTVYGMDLFGNALPLPFSRMSSATRRLKNGNMELAAQNMPRINYDYSTGDGALLLEPSATNTFTNSETATGWGELQSCTITTATGTLTPAAGGVKFVATATNTRHSAFKILTTTFPPAGSTISLSFYVKASGYTGLLFIFYDRGSNSTLRNRAGSLNLSTGTMLINNAASGENVSMVNCGNGWYRVKWENWVTQPDSATNASVEIYLSNTPQSNLNAKTFVGDGVSGCTITGMQIETGPVCTSYIPTAGATVTRSADSLDAIGNMLAAGYSYSDRGTLYYNGGYKNLAAAPVITLKDNTGMVKAELKAAATNALFLYDAVQATNTANTIAATYPRKLALRWGAAGTQLAINGNVYNATTEPAAYGIDSAQLNGIGSYGGIHTVKELALFPYAFSNTQLQNLAP